MPTLLEQLSLRAFVEALAADRPTPGSGATAALALALAAACCAKACRITARRRGGSPELETQASTADALAGQALDLAQRDADHFQALLAKDDSARTMLLEDARLLQRAALALAVLLSRAEADCDGDLLADLRAARALAEAAAVIQRDNLEGLTNG